VLAVSNPKCVSTNRKGRLESHKFSPASTTKNERRKIMSRPKFPTGTILTQGAISRIREEQNVYDRNPEEYDRHKQEWSLEECKKRGSLPTGEPLENLFGTGY